MTTREVIVHDFDFETAEANAHALVTALPDHLVRVFCTRTRLLEHVASLLPPGDQAPPACLIDIRHRGGSERGLQIIRTIVRHPDLRGRVAPVAFTRYNHARLAAAYEGAGAVGIAAPIDVTREGFAEWLARIVAGPSRVSPFHQPPAAEEDVRFLQHVCDLFPHLAELPHDRRMDEALSVLTVCRLFRDGYSRTTIQARVRSADIARIRDQLDPVRAQEISAVPPGGTTIDLGAVARYLSDVGTESSRLLDELLVERSQLDAAGRLRWAEKLSIESGQRSQAGVWIPPDDVAVLRDFLERVVELLRSKTHVDTEFVQTKSEQAIDGVAARYERSSQDVLEAVIHGIACLEDWAADLPDEDPRGGRMFPPAPR